MKLKQKEFYCVFCRNRVTCKDKDIKVVVYPNKRVGKVPALKCKCSVCGTNLTKFIKHDSQDSMIKKYGKTVHFAKNK